jgi:hypothetical protein
MIDLEKMERLAREALEPFPAHEYPTPAAAREASGAIRADREQDLARALLAVLPVIRAAEEWYGTEQADLTFDPFARDHLDSIDRLKRALTTLRRQMQEGE